MNTAAGKIGRLRRIVTAKPVIIGMILLALYALSGFLLAPWLIRQQVPKLAEQHLGAEASVAAVRVNPFLLTLEVTDLGVAEKNNAPALQIGRLLVDLEVSSLLRQAWIFRQIVIDRPMVAADLNARESLNLVRLFTPRPTKSAATAAAPAKPPRFVLEHFVLSGGNFRYVDHSVQPSAHARFEPVNFEVRDVSTLPEQRGKHTLTARLPGGGSLQWQGELTLEPVELAGSISVKDAKLATLWRFVQDHLAIAEPSGAYDLGLRYRIRNDRSGYFLQADQMSLRLTDLSLAKKNNGATLARLTNLVLANGDLDLRKRTLSFKDVQLGKGEVNVVLDDDGVPDWATLVTNTAAKPPVAATAPPPAWQISLPKIGIGPLALSVIDHSRVRPLRVDVATAEAHLGVTAATGAKPQVTVSNGNLKIGEVRVRSGDSPEALISLGTTELTDATYDLQNNTARAGLLRLTGGRTLVGRDASGKIDLVDAFVARREKPAPDSGIGVTLDRLEIAGHSFTLNDRSFTPVAAYDLENVQATAASITLPFNKTVPVELAFSVRQGGKLQAKGSLDGQGRKADVRFDATDIALQPLDSVLRQYTGLTLAAGKAGIGGRLAWNGSSAASIIRFSGSAAITDIDLKSADSGERLISWQRMSGKDINFDSGENRLAFAQLDLARPYAKLVINKNRTTNLSEALRSRAPAAAPAKPASKGSPLAIRMDRLSVDRGAMDFADLSLVLPFATHIKALGGAVTGLSSAESARASLKFEGRVAEFGLARAEGSLQPFTPKKFTDITVTFRNVALPELSPYTATFAGRTIASGKLSLDLEYKLDNSKLAGENKILLEQLVLGERVESPTALDLPLDLAVALLTDSDGKINLTVPVTGDVDNPEFNYGQVISQAIGASISGIVTAPFRALAAIFGGNAQELSDIVFDPGSARILPTEYEKVRRVVEGLRERPKLRLMVQGLFHRESDDLALRTRTVRAELAVREGLTLNNNQDPGPVAFSSARTQRAIESMFDEKIGGDAVGPFAYAFGIRSGRTVRRVNPLRAVTGSGGGDPELYEALYQELIARKTLAPTALPDLAGARATAITNAFLNRFKFEPARIGEIPPAATDDVASDGVPAKLSFAPIK